MSTYTNAELAELAATQRPRCLGCGAPLEDGWTPHGTCRPYYGAGPRVDYARWLKLVERVTNDGPLFRLWSEAEPAAGIPSWWPSSGRPPTHRYEDTHGPSCRCGACLPSLTELAEVMR